MVSMVSTQKGVTALMFAKQGHVTVARLLIGKGVDVNMCAKVVMDFVSCTCMWTFMYHVHVCGHSVSWMYVTYV